MAKAQFHPAPEVEEVAVRVLAREECTDHLMITTETRIVYLIMDGPETNSWIGRCYRTVGPFQNLTAYNFVIAVYRDWWDKATDQQKEALVFHELMHVGYKLSQKGETTWCLRDHFIEMFPQEVALFGPWNTGLQELKDTFNSE
jgi:hypothetical protein